MRQIIKFRGKRIDNGKWVFGDLIHQNDGRIEICTHIGTWRENPEDVDAYGEEFVVNPDTVGQFTSLHDKNGKEIYEGDLLRYLPVNKWDEENFVAHEVFFHDNDYCDKHIGWQMNRRHFQGHICGTSENPQMKPSTTAQMEVIGNIHDNLELIKGEDK